MNEEKPTKTAEIIAIIFTSPKHINPYTYRDYFLHNWPISFDFLKNVWPKKMYQSFVTFVSGWDGDVAEGAERGERLPAEPEGFNPDQVLDSTPSQNT